MRSSSILGPKDYEDKRRFFFYIKIKINSGRIDRNCATNRKRQIRQDEIKFITLYKPSGNY